MSKRKGRKTLREVTLTRREFLKRGLLIAGGITVSGGIGSLLWKLFTEDEQVSHERGYEVISSLLKEVKLDRNSTLISSEEAQPIIRMGIDYIKNKKVSHPNDPNEIFVPSKVLSVEKYIEQSLLVEPDSKYAQRISRLSRRALDHGLKFWGSPYLSVPTIGFFIPTSKSDISLQPLKNNVDIYMCYSFQNRVVVLVNFDYNGRIITFEHFVKEEVGGHQSRRPQFRVLEKEIVLEKEESTPLFVSLSAEPIYIVESPVVEVLHYQLHPHTNRNMLAEFNKIQRNPDGSVSGDLLAYGMNKWVKLEEVLAHAITKLWLEEYNQYARLGFTRQQLENKVYGPYTSESIDLSRRIVSRIGGAVEAYATNPESLFSY